MQAFSVISNSITQDIRLKGHQSIRFAPDGFSVLISDVSYTPVYLKHFAAESPVPVEDLIAECSRALDDEGLLSFEGETVLISDSMAATLLPKQFVDVDKNREILEKICSLDKTDRVFDRSIKTRDFHLIYSVPEKIIGLGNRFAGDVKILHASECLLSLSDQVKSSDHQRGVVMAEVQTHTLDLLVVAEDRVLLLNRYWLNDPSDFIYHTLNTMRQLDLDRRTIPVYLSGVIHEEHEYISLLAKYIRNVVHTPYYLEHLSREDILRFMILSEGSKCV
ncbi:MAG: DUF3822 family protein [Bacteroidota bacterium]|nr:DUF3822 family protein [Bacteroidota bacterium]